MDLLGNLDYVLVYINDIYYCNAKAKQKKTISKRWKLYYNNLMILASEQNCANHSLCKKEVDYLGFLLTSEGIKLQPKKIEAMTRIKPPTNSKQLKLFLGMVNFYRDMWPECLHCLAPLCKLLSKNRKTNWLWEKVHQQAFDEAKKMLCKNAMLAYPDFEISFDLYTDASDLQLGATLVQSGKPIGFYTRKINSA